jgi:catechol 2,3-dioxygenase
MVHPKRVGHLVLNVKDVVASTNFYIEVMGFEIAKQSDTATFLTCGKIHHDLALFQASDDATPVSKGGLGLNHMALQVEDFDMLTEYHHNLERYNIKIDRTTDHGMTSSIYITDPDGNGIELFCNNQATSEEGLEIMRSPDRENKELFFAPYRV